MSESIKNEVFLDMIVRIISLENLLVTKKIVSNEEIQNEITKVSSIVISSMKDQIIEAGYKPNDINKVIQEFIPPKKNIKIN